MIFSLSGLNVPIAIAPINILSSWIFSRNCKQFYYAFIVLKLNHQNSSSVSVQDRLKKCVDIKFYLYFL